MPQGEECRAPAVGSAAATAVAWEGAATQRARSPAVVAQDEDPADPSATDGVVLVVHSAKTMRDSALAVSRRLTEDGTRVLGTVLNNWDPRDTNDYGYGSGYRHYSS